MRLSRYFLPTLKEAPADADTLSAKLMLKAGLVRKVAAGLFEWLPLGLRVLRKVENIIRQEMDRVSGLEVLLPVLQPKSLWDESGRWKAYGKEMVRLKDRKDTEFCLAPTAEEVITDLVRRDVRSYRELPLLLYQFGEKFRDEIRPRFGVMRAREFLMKDAYSFHADDASLEKTYQEVFGAYHKIFERCGLKFRPVEADTGAIGGKHSHEFMVLADTGEEFIASCDSCGYAANVERAEVAPVLEHSDEPMKAPEEVDTPNLSSVDDVAKFLKMPADRFIKTLFYVADGKPVVVLMRGDTELNEIKLARALNAKELEKASEEVYQKVAGCRVGFAGPVGLNATLVADQAVTMLVNAVSGANKDDKHLKNININRDFKPSLIADLRLAKAGDLCSRCRHPFIITKGIEVGHTFKLGKKYSEAMQATFLNEAGQRTVCTMGCYGIGVSRVVAAAIEQCQDENGIIWPEALAPFSVVILPLNVSEPTIMEAAESLYKSLQERGVDVLLDDRDARAGVKFKDADLIGIPWRITIGEKKLPQGLVELKKRGDAAAQDVTLTSVLEVLTKNNVVIPAKAGIQS